MQRDCEIEFKFALVPSDAAAFRRLALLRQNCVAGPKRRKLLNIYFDTPTRVLKERAIALRLCKLEAALTAIQKSLGLE